MSVPPHRVVLDDLPRTGPATANHGHTFRMIARAVVAWQLGTRQSPWSNTQDRGRRTFVPAWYEIRVAGQLDETAADAFAGLDVAIGDAVTAIRGELDQAGLNGLLERIRSLQLDLVDVRRVRRAPIRPAD